MSSILPYYKHSAILQAYYKSIAFCHITSLTNQASAFGQLKVHDGLWFTNWAHHEPWIKPQFRSSCKSLNTHMGLPVTESDHIHQSQHFLLFGVSDRGLSYHLPPDSFKLKMQATEHGTFYTPSRCSVIEPCCPQWGTNICLVPIAIQRAYCICYEYLTGMHSPGSHWTHEAAIYWIRPPVPQDQYCLYT